MTKAECRKQILGAFERLILFPTATKEVARENIKKFFNKMIERIKEQS